MNVFRKKCSNFEKIIIPCVPKKTTRNRCNRAYYTTNYNLIREKKYD